MLENKGKNKNKQLVRKAYLAIWEDEDVDFGDEKEKDEEDFCHELIQPIMTGIVTNNEVAPQVFSLSPFYAFLIMSKVNKHINYFYKISNNHWSSFFI